MGLSLQKVWGALVYNKPQQNIWPLSEFQDLTLGGLGTRAIPLSRC